MVPCAEHYTSKTCSECGNIDHKLGASKIYHCKCCASIMDRDLNASKNIL
jgi:putative transposase